FFPSQLHRHSDTSAYWKTQQSCSVPGPLMPGILDIHSFRNSFEFWDLFTNHPSLSSSPDNPRDTNSFKKCISTLLELKTRIFVLKMVPDTS
ncbi:hypothetical protein DV515_00001289, partial [Chloebia gouldiae]